MNKTYIIAINEIRKHVDATQAVLDAAAAEARAATIADYKAAVLEGVDPETPAFSICSLVSQTLTVGREKDGYPEVSIPEETRKVLKAGVAAGIIVDNGGYFKTGSLHWYRDLSAPSERIGSWGNDYAAWTAALEYKKRNKAADV